VDRRTALKSAVAAGAAAAVTDVAPVEAALAVSLPKLTITRVKIFQPPNLNQTFNQSNMVVTVDTSNPKLTGVGEGGCRDMLEQCAGRLIGKNPFSIERCWQDMYRAWFYPPGREKIHALGALDLALWDIKGKALDVPVYDLIGGMNRNYLECYATGGAGGMGGTLAQRAAAAMKAGYRIFRIDAASGPGTTFNSRTKVNQVIRDAAACREGVGESGDWMIDFHQRFDFADCLRACRGIEEFEPYMVEDPVRTESFLQDIPRLRNMTSCPIGAGEEWGQRWDFHRLVENHDIDFNRCTLPNVGGITEMLKIAALCETHDIGIVPHFTGPIATAALVHALGPFVGPVTCEYNYGATKPGTGQISHLNEFLTFREGKLWPNNRPGLGVVLNMGQLKQIAEISQPGPNRTTYYRPDGSQTNW
jgi:L-alanine-DL-glutamate epimerase-like enolase superfamily enzyme